MKKKSNPIEWDDICWRQHVDERVTHVAFVLQTETSIMYLRFIKKEKENASKLLAKKKIKIDLEINGQIEKIISFRMIFINGIEQHLGRVSRKRQNP